MIPELDIWRAAQVMVKRYGDGAATEAAMRADEFLDHNQWGQTRLISARVRASDPFDNPTPLMVL